MKNYLFVLLCGVTLLLSCQKQAGPQPQTTNTTQISNYDPLVNSFEQHIIGTWKAEYRIKEYQSGGLTVYDTLAAPDTSWTVTFTSNNPVIPSNGYAPYKKDASGKMDDLQNVSGGSYELHKWYGLAGTDSPTYSQYTGSIYMDGYGTCQSTCYYGTGKLTIRLDEQGYYYNYVLKKIS